MLRPEPSPPSPQYESFTVCSTNFASPVPSNSAFKRLSHKPGFAPQNREKAAGF